ncbi:hypothetical protein [Xenophilus sp. Marseille-Q4582]|uniref:hypothetical protein n=1 Tax=Xenophilus sp. Marseille-Q4582 TaxID=2866600 RepID=UPI001CE3BF70|nr:hypothetical protein [Xenophilus sp. Marseille-Q4582]
MFCTLYILRRDGKKLPVDEVRAAGIAGWLWMGQNPKLRFPRTDAIFQPRQAGEHPLMLQYAHVKRIEAGGIMIYGQDETSPQNAYIRQTWWLVPSSFGSTPTLPP